MNEVNEISPRELFARLMDELPAEVRDHVFVVGSLAAACHHADKIVGGKVRTKDIDLVVHPAADVSPAAAITGRLLDLDWHHKPSDWVPGDSPIPVTRLPYIRLYPPHHQDYFVEILIVPDGENPGVKPTAPVKLNDGWYGLPSFEFLALTAVDRQRSDTGLEYAHPSMMALANLLSHRELGDHVMSTDVGGRPIQRSSKDLGRVLALARLESREETEQWGARWRRALAVCFPTRWPELAVTLGAGLRSLLEDDVRFDEAWHCCVHGLLATTGATHEQLRYTAAQLLVDTIEPVEADGRLARL